MLVKLICGVLVSLGVCCCGPQIIPLAKLLAEVYQAGERFLDAAQTQRNVDLSQARNLSPAFKADWLISTAEYFLGADDGTMAADRVSHAQREMADVKDVILTLRFKVHISGTSDLLRS